MSQNHLCELAFIAVSARDTGQPTAEECLAGLQARLDHLRAHPEEVLKACNLPDPMDDMPDSDETMGKRIMARFHPQAWQRDYAVDVDPEGAVQFDVTLEILAMGKKRALKLRDDRDESDLLKNAAKAPAWIKNWSGPFWVEVEEAVGAYFADEQ